MVDIYFFGNICFVIGVYGKFSYLGDGIYICWMGSKVFFVFGIGKVYFISCFIFCFIEN